MAENSKIEWTDHTFNPWIGCAKVSAGCAHCYAETLDRQRFSKTMGAGSVAAPVGHWGKGALRHRTKTWDGPVRWNRWTGPIVCTHCAREFAPMLFAAWLGRDPVKYRCGCGGETVARRPRVFCASMADWLDDEVPVEWLADLLRLIFETPNLDWLLLTKRPENWAKRLRAILDTENDESNSDWLYTPDGRPGWALRITAWLGDIKGLKVEAPQNVWLGTSVENQALAEVRIPELLKIPARVRFLSCEPLLGRLDICEAMGIWWNATNKEWMREQVSSQLHWVIAGGESGKGARPMHPTWARSLRDQCQTAGVPFFFKQWGDFHEANLGNVDRSKQDSFVEVDGTDSTHWTIDRHRAESTAMMVSIGKKAAGRLLDGVEWNEFPREAAL